MTGHSDTRMIVLFHLKAVFADESMENAGEIEISTCYPLCPNRAVMPRGQERKKREAGEAFVLGPRELQSVVLVAC